MPGQAEHVIAYCGTAILCKLTWPLHRTRTMGTLLIALAAVLEVGQIWVPGRTSQLIDFASSSSGAAVGLLISYLLLKTRVLIPSA